MGPPLFSDGNISLPMPLQGENVRLQWGRRFSATETSWHYSGTFFAVRALQWGRRFSATETDWDKPTWFPRIDCFNGAAAFQRRKLRPRRGGIACHRPRFNGAAAFQRRKPSTMSPQP